MYRSEAKVRVRYAETDQMGYVYYGNYASYYEVGRVEAMRALGLSYKDLEDSGIMMPVLNMTANYIKPARYDDELTIVTLIGSLPGVKMHFRYELFNADDELINIGETTLIFWNKTTRRPARCPEPLLNSLKSYFK